MLKCKRCKHVFKKTGATFMKAGNFTEIQCPGCGCSKLSQVAISIPVIEVDEDADQRIEDYFAKKGS